MPTGPTVIVDTSPRALAAEGLMMQAARAEGQASDGLRAARRRTRIPMMGGASEPPQAPSPKGQILVNKLG